MSIHDIHNLSLDVKVMLVNEICRIMQIVFDHDIDKICHVAVPVQERRILELCAVFGAERLRRAIVHVVDVLRVAV